MVGIFDHWLLATITLGFLLASAITGLLFFWRSLGKWRKPLLIIHIITGLLTLIFFLLTYFLAPRF